MRPPIGFRALLGALAAAFLLAALTAGAAYAADGEDVMQPAPQTGECVVGTVGSGVGGTTSTDNGGVTAPGCIDLGALPGGSGGGPGGPGGDPDNPLGEIPCVSGLIPSPPVTPSSGGCPSSGAMRDGLQRMMRDRLTNPRGCTSGERVRLFFTVVVEATPHRGECVTPTGAARPGSQQILF
jgi:ABC-type amino acid transport substrate-binding protein